MYCGDNSEVLSYYKVNELIINYKVIEFYHIIKLSWEEHDGSGWYIIAIYSVFEMSNWILDDSC